jgi:DNA-binding NtrC family response regulator
MRRLGLAIEAAARSRASVLITGEPGAGKRLVARRIHALSKRRDRPFLEIGCGALPHTVLEADLFGDERASAVGVGRPGRLLQAHGGTLFLDEVSELSIPAQGRLLDLLGAGTFSALGTSRPQRVDVRVISATHHDLRDLVRQKRFRVELLYRLKVLHLDVPPLRKRAEDIAQLADHFLRRAAATRAQPLTLSASALKALLAHPFPGNVRELEEAIHSAAACCGGDVVHKRHLPRQISGDSSSSDLAVPTDPPAPSE